MLRMSDLSLGAGLHTRYVRGPSDLHVVKGAPDKDLQPDSGSSAGNNPDEIPDCLSNSAAAVGRADQDSVPKYVNPPTARNLTLQPSECPRAEEKPRFRGWYWHGSHCV